MSAPSPSGSRGLLPFRRATGTVATFDEPRGLGTVRSDGGAELPFHCTAIADGTRTIDVGRRVAFTVVAGVLGRWEAADIRDSGVPE